jgi:hypothetical protein
VSPECHNDHLRSVEPVTRPFHPSPFTPRWKFENLLWNFEEKRFLQLLVQKISKFWPIVYDIFLYFLILQLSSIDQKNIKNNFSQTCGENNGFLRHFWQYLKNFDINFSIFLFESIIYPKESIKNIKTYVDSHEITYYRGGTPDCWNFCCKQVSFINAFFKVYS